MLKCYKLFCIKRIKILEYNQKKIQHDHLIKKNTIKQIDLLAIFLQYKGIHSNHFAVKKIQFVSKLLNNHFVFRNARICYAIIICLKKGLS